MNRNSLLALFFLYIACIASAESNRPAQAGIPYRLLWHAYCLSNLSSQSDDYLVITSRLGVNPEKFVFRPLNDSGDEPVKCNSSGISFVRWTPKFYENNTLVFVDQPKGSINLAFKWHVQSNLYPSLICNILINGRVWVESTYHWLVLSEEFPGF